MEIDLDALVENYKQLRRLAGRAKVMAVLKANAYGHGLIECAQVLDRECQVDYLGVAIVEEGVRLREAGVQAPILVFGGVLNDQVGIYLKHNLDLTASSVDKLALIESVAKDEGARARIHIKIDTGMGRLGVRPSSARNVFEAAIAAQHCEVVGAFTHFATADEEDLSFARTQLDRFIKCLRFFPEHNRSSPECHAANSGALLQLPESHLDMVRCGITLFGVSPSENLRPLVARLLKPVMKVSSRVVYFKVVQAGESVSYGRSWTAQHNTRVVTIPLGYGDGYMRGLSNRAEVLIHGKRYPVIGKVCMDQIMVDIGEGTAYNGDEVVLIGEQGNERISIEELATHADTIPYEILTALNQRIPRRYVRGSGVVAAEVAHGS